MPTVADGLAFCQLLHARLAAHLADVNVVRARVDSLLPRNSFRESCFCKGCVLPVVDAVTTDFLSDRHGASQFDVHRALRCEGFDTPLYTCDESQSGFSSHSRSNSYHPGDKSGRRLTSRRSPDFCIRFGAALQLAGEVKYLRTARPSDLSKIVRELRDYLSVVAEPTSDWGHDVGYGLVYDFAGGTPRTATAVTSYWDSDRIFVSCLAGT